MKIYGMSVIKNEADVIAQTLTSAAQWCDYIYVFDNGSGDGTWEIVQSLAADNPTIVPFKQDDCTFLESLRRDIFLHYAENNAPGDWWVRLDSDEIYVDDPRQFFPKVPRDYDVVWGAMLQYYFTDEDLRRYEQDPSAYADSLPTEQKCRYYLNNWSEPRAFRYDRTIYWPPKRSWPILGRSAPMRIRIKHYQYRSPESIQRRIEVRRINAAKGGFSFPHEVLPNWQRVMDNPNSFLDKDVDQNAKHAARHLLKFSGEEWKERIVDAATLERDAHDGQFVIRDDLMPNLPRISTAKLKTKKWIAWALNRISRYP